MHYFSGSGNARKTIALGNIFANHPDTTIDYFYETVNRLFARHRLPYYRDIALSLYKIGANHKNATPDYISRAAGSIAKLADNQAAVKLYEKLATCSYASASDISHTTKELLNLGYKDAAL
jgi:hypothetical protein